MTSSEKDEDQTSGSKTPDPRDTDHPAGEDAAAENAANESPS